MPTYPGLAAYGGDIVSADDINANIPIAYVKANSDSRNTTTTLAADLELTGIPLGVGVWDIELLLFWSQVTTATQKLKTRWIFSGTWNSPIRACIGAGSAQTGNPATISDATMQGISSDGTDAVYNVAGNSAYCVSIEKVRNAVVTTAGTMALHWAQSVSNANATSVLIGTNFLVRQASE